MPVWYVLNLSLFQQYACIMAMRVQTVYAIHSDEVKGQGAVVVFFAWTFVNVSCWWVGYCCGFMTLFLMMIMFGVTSAIVIPFGDLCLGLPVTGEVFCVHDCVHCIV